MQFVILKDEYELDQYGVEIKNKIATECNEYLQTGECSLTIRPADSPDVVHVDENEVPDDVKTVLKTAYEAREKYLSPVSRTTKEGAARLRVKAEYDNAMKALDEFSHKDEISLLDFVQEFFKHVPDKIKKEIIDNEYKVMTNFSDADFYCYEEFAKISSKELKISRKKTVADDEDTVKTCDLEFNGKITYATDLEAMKLRIKLLEENSKPLSVPWKGENYIKKEIKAGKSVMVVYDEYTIPFHGIMTKAYAEMLAKLFLNTDGSMKRWAINESSKKRKLHKKTYSIQ